MIETIGIIGVGHLTRHIIEGLKRHDDCPVIVVSPRGAAAARDMADRFGVEIAADNAEVVTRADAVIIAPRPSDVPEAIRGLPWRAGQAAISAAARVPLAAIEELVAPADAVISMPVISGAFGQSPTVIYPDNPAAREIFARIGSVNAMPDEAAYEAASVMGAVFGWMFGFIAETAAWGIANGVPAAEARQLAIDVFRGPAGLAAWQGDVSLEDLRDEIASPGSLTRTGLDHLAGSGALEAWRQACQIVLSRIRDE